MTATPLDLDALEAKRRALKDCAYFSYAKAYDAFKYELYRHSDALIEAARERDELKDMLRERAASPVAAQDFQPPGPAGL